MEDKRRGTAIALKRLAWVGAAVGVVLVCVFGGAIVYELATPARIDLPGSRVLPESLARAVATAVATTDTQTQSPPAAVQTASPGNPPTSDTLGQADPPQWMRDLPDYFQDPARRQIIAQYEALLREIRAYQTLKEDASTTTGKAWKQLVHVGATYEALCDTCGHNRPRFAGIARIYKTDIEAHHPEALREFIQWRKTYLGPYERWRALAEFELYADAGGWVRAREVSRLSSYLGWPYEKYCLEQMGERGKLMIAGRSSERIYKAMKYSILSIGPGFEPPHMELWY